MTTTPATSALAEALLVRPVVAWFAAEMERQLRENDHKGGWEYEDIKWLLRRCREELDELDVAVAELWSTKKPERSRLTSTVVEEAADVANFALMVADNIGPHPLPDHILVKREDWERLIEVIGDGIEAFRLTREYVGLDLLPEIDGWSWFDWCQKARAALAPQPDRTHGGRHDPNAEGASCPVCVDLALARCDFCGLPTGDHSLACASGAPQPDAAQESKP